MLYLYVDSCIPVPASFPKLTSLSAHSLVILLAIQLGVLIGTVTQLRRESSKSPDSVLSKFSLILSRYRYDSQLSS